MDSELAADGDLGFRGFASRPDPVTLDRGMCALANNKRFNRGRAETRKGLRRLADEINAAGQPLVLPFFLGDDVAVSSAVLASNVVTVTTATAHGWSSGLQVNVRGANETDFNGDFTITVTGASEFTYGVTAGDATATGTLLANDGPVLRTVYSGGLYGAALFSSPLFNAGQEWIAMAGTDALWLWRDGETVTSKSYPAGETVDESDRVSVQQAFDELFILRETALDGIYARQTVVSMTRSSTTVTVTVTGHGYSTGDRVRIEGADQAAYNYEFDVTVTGVDAFTFEVDHSPTSPATGTMTARVVKAPMVWDGESSTVTVTTGGSHPVGATYSRLPGCSVAAYFNNQLVVAPTPARDVLLVSDVLDTNTFDPLLKSFRPNAGSSDYIVGLHPYAEGQVLVLMRSSLYMARIILDLNGVDISAAESQIELLTNEIGCVARDSVVTAGQWIYFLSDSGVYRLDSNFSDLRLRGQTVPLSDAISDVFDTINWSKAHLSNGVWFDNRYWLAVPIGDVDGPNALLIFNALNEAWESVDSYPAEISRLVVGTYGGKRRLFGVTRSGNLFLMEEDVLADDAASAEATEQIPIAGLMRTRRYSFGTAQPKRWLRSISSLVLAGGGSEVTTTARFFDPDLELAAGGTVSAAAGDEDFVQKLSLRRQAAFVDLELADVAGRSTVRTVAVQAVGSDPQLVTREVS